MTEAAGAAYVAWQTAEVVRLERAAPAAPAGPAKLFMSVDGARVPWVGGARGEIKTLVLGAVQPPQVVKSETIVRTVEHSFFSHMNDGEGSSAAHTWLATQLQALKHQGPTTVANFNLP